MGRNRCKDSESISSGCHALTTGWKQAGMLISKFKYRIRQCLRYLDNALGFRAWLRADGSQERQPGAFLDGDRTIENGWVISHLPSSPVDVLDVGAAGSCLSDTAAGLGHRVTAVDMNPLVPLLQGVVFRQGDFLEVDLDGAKFDCVIACSSLEHFGLAGRYDSKEDSEGDLKGMARICAFLKPHGRVLLTIPVGRDLICRPWHRIYGETRLPRLLDGYRIICDQYWAKTPEGKWKQCDRQHALRVQGSDRFYALGLFVLTKNTSF